LIKHEHKQLVETITKLDEVPIDSDNFSKWITAESHLEFLQQNALADEIAICALGAYSFVNTVAVRNYKLKQVDSNDLLGWNFNAYMPIASYTIGGRRKSVWIDRGLSRTGSKSLNGAVPLVFGRTFEGWSGPGRNYFELHQEYMHLTDIHWRPEKRAYCRYDEHGDLESIVSITAQEDRENKLALVSFKWSPLEEYLVASNASLVRMFDFTLYQRTKFSGWESGQERLFSDSPNLFYRQKVVPAHAAYTRGIQIIRPRRPQRVIYQALGANWFKEKSREYAEYVAFDWRNNRIAKISTDPSATTNYFDAETNSLPFELSPAFFRPEVLLKYKTDRDKYTVGERSILCRTAWYLEGIDVNKAGQVHAYICDLRRLPYTEQLHWLSYNELPKSSISERAIVNDFQGKWTAYTEPLQNVLSIIQRWHDKNVVWWKLRDSKLLNRVIKPLTESRDEWAESFMDLSKLVIEGFETKPIRTKLDTAQIKYKEEDKTIILFEKLLNRDTTSGEVRKLVGLRTVQHLRSKTKGHFGGSESEQLAQDALMEHETFGNHFNHVCSQVANDLEFIEQLMS
jgi:hypothetical protein